MLSGTFSVFPLAEVLGLVERSVASGALVVRGREVDGSLYFAGGELCGGEVSDLSGPVPDIAGLEVRLLEVCVSLLRCRDAEFEFRADLTPPWPAPLTLPVAPVLARATAIAREWPAIMTTVESFDSILERTGTLTDESITLSRIGFQVLEHVDGNRTIRELARGVDASLIVIGPEVRSLVLAGAVRVVVGAERALSSARADAERASNPAAATEVGDVLDVTDWGTDVRTAPMSAPMQAPTPPPGPAPAPAPTPAPVAAAAPAPEPVDADALARERADLAVRAGLSSAPAPEPASPAPVPEAPVVERSEIVVDRSELLRMFSGLKDD